MYKDPELGLMTPASATKFVLGATLEEVDEQDNRITGIFKSYAKKDQSGQTLEREEFLKLYYSAALRGVKGREDINMNLRNHFIRPDLKKLKDVEEDVIFAKDEMPRFTMSAR